jgi:hypothetical protein
MDFQPAEQEMTTPKKLISNASKMIECMSKKQIQVQNSGQQSIS